MLDPHGAIGYMALKNYLSTNKGSGIFLETAHPAKFLETVEPIIGKKVDIPVRLQKFIEGESKTIRMSGNFNDFKAYLASLK